MQLLVRVVDKTSKDPRLDLQLTKRGDVIVVKPDGESWGLEELINPDWRIVSIPEMSEAEALALLAPEHPPLDKPDQPVRKRAFKLDIDALIAKGYALDGKRQVETKDAAEAAIATQVDVTDVQPVKADVDAAKVLKPASADAEVVGGVETGIGPT